MQVPLPRNLLGFGRAASAWSQVIGANRDCWASQTFDVSRQPVFYVFQTPKQPLGARQAANRWKGLGITRRVAANACDGFMQILRKLFYCQERFHGRTPPIPTGRRPAKSDEVRGTESWPRRPCVAQLSSRGPTSHRSQNFGGVVPLVRLPALLVRINLLLKPSSSGPAGYAPGDCPTGHPFLLSHQFRLWWVLLNSPWLHAS